MKEVMESVEQDLQLFTAPVNATLTQYGAALALLKQARQDAKDWMTKYRIEVEVCDKADKDKAAAVASESAQYHRALKAERKARLLASVIATLIDSEEFV